MFLRTVGWVWLLTTVGAGCCGLLAGGMTTIALFVFSIPVGLMLGAIAGLPIGIGLAGWFVRAQSPPTGPARFAAQVEAIGGGIALLINTPMNVGTVVIQATSTHGPFDAGVSDSTIVLLVLVAFASIIGSALIGRTCGYLLACRHIARFGVGPPEHLAPWTLRPRAGRLP